MVGAGLYYVVYRYVVVGVDFFDLLRVGLVFDFVGVFGIVVFVVRIVVMCVDCVVVE